MFGKMRRMEFQRYFSRADAVRTLPLVKRIVADILDTGRSLRHYLQQAAPRHARVTAAAGATLGEQRRAAERLWDEDPTIQEHRAALLEYLAELDSIGCLYKDWNFDLGLIDFPAIVDGEQVFLCWRSDEPELAFYHRIEDGYAGRRPLPPDWTGER